MAIQQKRKVDEQGRLPIPLPMRQLLHLQYRDAVVWTVEEGKVVIRPAANAIVLTGQTQTRVDDVGKVQVPRNIAQLGVVAGVEVELTCEDQEITFPVPQS